MFKIIKNGTEPKSTQAGHDLFYEVKYFKTAIDREGNEVEVVDDERVERVTVSQLEAQKVGYQNMIKEIDSKLLEITKLV
jgi:hypothetical protein